jgi:hypothetical protein
MALRLLVVLRRLVVSGKGTVPAVLRVSGSACCNVGDCWVLVLTWIQCFMC